ncbi:MAG: hypothetical protein R2707_07335 [Acidimicrobiales bacterium]
MTEPMGKSKEERKKARRRERKNSERAEAQKLEALAAAGVESALALAPEVAAAPDRDASERVIDAAVTTVDAARFVRKRINEALAFEEWLDEVEAWVWDAETSVRAPLTELGATCGVELRLEQARPTHP